MARLAAAESARLAAAAAAARDADDARRAREEAERIAAAREAEEAAAREAAADRAARYRAAMAAGLPPEPARGDEGTDADLAAVALRFALPDGSTRTRRFAPSDPIRAAFDFVRAVGGAGEGETFRLVTRWPRTILEEEAAEARTVRAAVADPTAALFVEKIARDEEPRRTA